MELDLSTLIAIAIVAGGIMWIYGRKT